MARISDEYVLANLLDFKVTAIVPLLQTEYDLSVP